MKKILLILLICLLCGCSNSQSPSGQNSSVGDKQETIANDKVLNMYAIRGNDLNPLLTSSESGRLMLSMVFRPLFTVGQNFDYSCCLAQDISSSGNCTVYNITLNDQMVWDDGSPFTSADVEYTVRKIMEYEELSPYYDNLRNVTGYSTNGTHGYTFVLNKPDSGFPCLLNFPIVKNGALESGVNTTGTGNYILTDHKDYSSFMLVAKSPKGKGYADKIKVTLLPDADSANSSYKLGKINLLKLYANDASAYSVDGQKEYFSSNTNRYSFLAVNHKNASLSDPAVRRLIATITSQDNVIPDLLPGFAVKADSFVNPGAYFALVNDATYGDTKEAFEKIGYIPDESGIRAKQTENGKRRLSFDILVNGDNASKVIAAEYIANLLGNYSINTTITKPDYNTYIDSLISGNFDLALCETVISLNNDYSFLMSTDGTANFGGYSSEKADTILESISVCADKSAKVDMFKQLQELFYKDMPHIPLWFQTSKIVYDTSVFKKPSVGGLSDEFSSLSSWTVK